MIGMKPRRPFTEDGVFFTADGLAAVDPSELSHVCGANWAAEEPRAPPAAAPVHREVGRPRHNDALHPVAPLF